MAAATAARATATALGQGRGGAQEGHQCKCNCYSVGLHGIWVLRVTKKVYCFRVCVLSRCKSTTTHTGKTLRLQFFSRN